VAALVSEKVCALSSVLVLKPNDVLCIKVFRTDTGFVYLLLLLSVVVVVSNNNNNNKGQSKLATGGVSANFPTGDLRVSNTMLLGTTRVSLPAKWHLILSNSVCRVHQCDR